MADHAQSGAEEGEERHAFHVTPHALVIELTEEHQRAARTCLERSGTIKFVINEISAARLPETLLQDGVLID